MTGATNTRANHRAAARPRPDRYDIKRSLIAHAEAVAIAELGKPSQRTRTELRWGRHGSTVLWLLEGRWYSFEESIGGDAADLICWRRKVSFGEAFRIAREYDGGHAPAAPSRAVPAGASRKRDGGKPNSAIALRIWGKRRAIKGSLAEIYYGQHRGLDVIGRLDVDHALGWDQDAQAVIALMTDPVTGEPTGLHRTFLNVDGSKRDRKMLGRAGVVRLSSDDSVTTSLGISEGVEDGLAVLLSGWCPVWAATSSGAVRRFPVLPAIETLTVFADADAAGLPAAEACRDRWREAGREVAIVAPRRSPS
jgi:hypothetical protein